MRVRATWIGLVVAVVLTGSGPARAADPDAAALARCDSLAQAGDHAEAWKVAHDLLAAVDARGDSLAAPAAEALARLVWEDLSRGGRLDPAVAGRVARLQTLVRTLDGPSGARYAKARLLAGSVAERGGEFGAARDFYAEALAVRERAGVPPDKDLVDCLVALANVRTRLGDYDGVAGLYGRARAVAEESCGRRSTEAAIVRVNHAIFAKRTGDYALARDLYEQALAIWIEARGEDTQPVARIRYNLGNLLIELQDYAGARAQYRRALATRERLLGHDSPEVARTLSALALAEEKAGDLLAARACAEQAVAVLHRALPPLHPQSAHVLSVLAVIQADLGDLEDARATLNEVLAIFEKAYGPEHFRVAEVVAEQGHLQALGGDTRGALASYVRARGIFTAAEAGRVRLPGLLNMEARLRSDLGIDPLATALAAQAVQLWKESPGVTPVLLGEPLATLGYCRWREGDLAGADSCLTAALADLEQTVGDGHPLYLTAALDLARVRRDQGATAEALDLALAVERGRRAALRVTFAGLPERLALEHARHWPDGLGFAVALAADGKLAGTDVARVWDELIASRALVLDVMALRRRAAAATVDAAADSLRHALDALTRERAGLLAAGWLGEEAADRGERVRDLRARAEAIEAQMAAAGAAGPGPEATLADVAAALPSTTALVGYVLNRRGPGPRPPTSYAALVCPAGGHDPVAVDLGDAAGIDRLVRAWRDEAGEGPTVPGRTPVDAETACRDAGAALRRRIWDPLQSALAGAGRVWVVPDGSLSLVNLAALPADDGGYLIDGDVPVASVDTERDLVPAPPAPPPAGGLLALGAPEVASGLGFVDLPASAEEVEAVADLWRRSLPPVSSAGVRVLVGSAASEEAFKELAPDYRALHVATHGFCLNGGDPSAAPGLRGVGGLHEAAAAAPGAEAGTMFRTGLVLAAGGDGEDGVLTAAEVAGLDLHGADWVVLSACGTGLGSTAAGEGVFGLRRAFRIAGARHLVISLWPLEDEASRDWMLALYRAHLEAGSDLTGSAWQAARAVLAARRAAGLDTHPHTWAAFVACGR